jgi:hypothetical protein
MDLSGYSYVQRNITRDKIAQACDRPHAKSGRSTPGAEHVIVSTFART